MWETWLQSLVWEDPLEKGKSAHSSILAWRIPWREEPGRQQSMGLQSQTRLKRLSMNSNLISYHVKFTWTLRGAQLLDQDPLGGCVPTSPSTTQTQAREGHPGGLGENDGSLASEAENKCFSPSTAHAPCSALRLPGVSRLVRTRRLFQVLVYPPSGGSVTPLFAGSS